MKKFHTLWLCAFLFACGGSAKQQPSPKMIKETMIPQTATEMVEEVPSPQAVPEKEETWYDGEIPIIFDAFKEYPITNIKLSELADAEYIALETNDSIIVRLIGTCKGNEFLFTDSHIYFEDRGTEIYIFTRKGKFVRKINRRGGGPEEYAFISSFAADPKHNELFVQDCYKATDIKGKSGRTYVYDMQGKYKRHFNNRASEIVVLNDSLLLNHFQYNPGGPRYSVVRKSDGSEVKKLHIRFPTKLPHDSHGRLQYGKLITSPRGVFMSHLGNDTVFEIMRDDLSVRPRIIDKSDYPTTFAQAHPTLETSRYLIFYILRCHNYKPHVDQHFYIYDKKERQIYQMKDYEGNDYWVLLDDYPHVTNWNKIQNPDMAVRVRYIYAILQGEGKHGDKAINDLANSLDEDDNPILQVMIFHDVESVKR